MAQNLDELNKLVTKSSFGKRLEMLYRVSDTLYKKTLELKSADVIDEELLYIVCMRYLNLVNNIKLQVKDERFHHMRFSKQIQVVENIKNACDLSLQERYIKNEPINLNETSIKEAIAELDGSKDIKEMHGIMQHIKDGDVFTNVDSLYKLIIDDSVQLLIIDARPTQDYLECSIKYHNVVHVPDEIIRKGLSTNTLQMKLSPENVTLFRKRHDFHVIVLIDTDTTRISFSSSKLEDLRTILVEWDLEQNYKILPLVVDGGIKTWADHYPSFVTNPSKIYNQFYGKLDELIDDIEYPDLSHADKVKGEEKSDSQKMVNDIKNDGFPSTRILQNIVTLAEHQLTLETNLLNLVEKRYHLKKDMINCISHGMKSRALDLKQLMKNISKGESYKIELNERRNLLDVEYNDKKTNDDGHLLKEMLNDIQVLDRKKLLKYQQRKNIEIRESPMDRELNYPAIEKSVKKRPEIPDRKQKPLDSKNYLQNTELKDRFRKSGHTGLFNIKNTCYMNSLVQCLRFCPMFLFSLTLQKWPNDKNYRLIYSITDLLKTMWGEERASVRPSSFYGAVCSADTDKGYSNGRHEDVHEFYIFLTKCLHNEVKTMVETDNRDCTARLKDWYNTFENTNSFINRTFYYQIEITTNCEFCNRVTVKYDYGNTIFLSLPEDGRSISLQDSLRNNLEEKDETTSKFCTLCERRNMQKKKITYYPTILCINIVRYAFNRRENCILRRNNECYFQTEIHFGLHKYILSSVSLHSGNRDVGHYTALCHNTLTKKWIEFNDESSSFVSPQDTKYRVQCYMFFYSLIQSSDDVNKSFFQQ